MRLLSAKPGFSVGLAGLIVCAPLLLPLGGCAAGAVAGAAVGTVGFAAKTTVKAGAVAVRGTGRAVGATARAIGGGGGGEPR